MEEAHIQPPDRSPACNFGSLPSSLAQARQLGLRGVGVSVCENGRWPEHVGFGGDVGKDPGKVPDCVGVGEAEVGRERR